MEDDSEVLDWGHEEEDSIAVHSEQRNFSVDDPEDAVSLGGDEEEDEFLTYQTRVPQGSAHSPAKSARQARQSNNDSPRPHRDHSVGSVDQSSLPGRTSLGTLVHALPPKPVASSVSFVHHSHPSVIEATAMASRGDRDKRNGKASVYEHNDPLPPGWEIKHPRSGRGVYYYNIHTQESTWIRPTFSTPREKRGERSDRRDDPVDKPLPTRNEAPRRECGDRPFNDRYYRSEESARREERQVSSSQLIDSYVPDSYSPSHRNTRASPPPPRTREREPSPPPRRPLSSAGSYGDRDGVQSSHREAPSLAALSAQDRVWVARDDVQHGRPRERRQRDDPIPAETDRRNVPRDTDRSSTLRPKSPASYTRGSQESANTTSHSAKSLSAAPSGRKSRFSQADSFVPHGHHQSESRDTGTWRARADDVASHSARYVGVSRSTSDVRADDDVSIYPASDVQRPGSKKRTALPPQDEIFRPGTRPTPVQRGGGYPAGPPTPPPVSENRHPIRAAPEEVHDMARRSPSQSPAPPLVDRDDRDRGHSRWSKPRPNGPVQSDRPPMHESSRTRVYDAPVDVDDAPLTRSSDPPTRFIHPRRPALQDEVPRYPRAMLNSDNDGPPRGIRDNRDGFDSRPRFTPDDSSRLGPPRDRQAPERHIVDQNTQKEPVRVVETRRLSFGSNSKLSGTNNAPMGGRSKFSPSVPSVAVPTSSPHSAPGVPLGGNGEPVAPRRDRVGKDYERLPRLDVGTGDTDVKMEPTKREDAPKPPPSNSRVLPQIETVPPPTPAPTRPSRAALGISRFGPPIVKEPMQPLGPQKSISSESIPSEQVPEGSTRATPPPASRESSLASIKDVTLPPVRPSHLPPRPASPPRGYRHQGNKPYSRPNPRSPVVREARSSELNVEAATTPTSPLARKRVVDSYPSQPPPVSQSSSEVPGPDLVQLSPYTSRVDAGNPRLSTQLAVPEERGPPPMHPERALMLQANGLPPRPLGVLGRIGPVKGLKRDRRDDHDRVEPLRGNSRGGQHSLSPGGDRHRFSEESRPMAPRTGSGVSLLDRLSLDDGTRINSPSLRERVELPSKRDREEMMMDFPLEVEGDDYDGAKRMRRRGGPKIRRGRL